MHDLPPAARRHRAPTQADPASPATPRHHPRLRAVTRDFQTLRSNASFHTPDGRPADPEYVQARLEEAGATLLSLPEQGHSTRLRSGALQAVHSAAEAYGWSSARLRPAIPSPQRISRMDEAFAWLALLPPDRTVIRRLVSARALVSPLTGRHLYAWRRLATLVGADHKAVQCWHAEGLRLIAAALNL